MYSVDLTPLGQHYQPCMPQPEKVKLELNKAQYFPDTTDLGSSIAMWPHTSHTIYYIGDEWKLQNR